MMVMEVINEGSIVKWLLQGVFVCVITIFTLSWLLKKLNQYIVQPVTATQGADSLQDNSQLYKSQESEVRKELQAKHDRQVQEYTNKLNQRREEAIKRKENSLMRFLVPSFLTSGLILGGETSESAFEDRDSQITDTQRAAGRRKLPVCINQEVAARVAAEAESAARKKKKPVITLAEEPDESLDDVISVMLRTPLGTVLKRRFLASDKIQCLLDFMSTRGYSQSRYAICMSFPRALLDNVDLSFADYNLGRRIALNIEEKD